MSKTNLAKIVNMKNKTLENELINQKKALIFVDWLSFSAETYQVIDEKLDNIKYKDIELIKTHRRTPNFKSIYDVYYKNMLIGTLNAHPNKQIMSDRHIIFKFENELLYTLHLSTYYKILKKQIPFKFLKINQVDIAIDQEQNQKQQSFMRKYAAGKIDFVGNQETTVTFKNSREIKYFRVGSRKSDKFLRCYYKRQELEISNKHYISEIWEKNGFDPDKEVFRTELSIKGSIMNKLISLDFTEDNNTHYFPMLEEKTMFIIQDQEFLKSVFERETRNFAQYYKQCDFNKRADQRKTYNIFDHLHIEPIFLLDRVKAEASKVFHKLKMLTKFLFELHIESGTEIYKYLSDAVCRYENMNVWRDEKIERWEKEHKRKLDNPGYKRYYNFVNKNLTVSMIEQGLKNFRAEQMKQETLILNNY